DKRKIDIANVGLEIAEGDIYKPETVEKAIEGQEAIISALGGKVFSGPLVCRDGIKTILPAMKKHGVKRLIAISAFGASEHRDFSPYTKLLRLTIPLPMHDKDEMEALIVASSVDWTIVRPAAYTDFWQKKGYSPAEVLAAPYPIVTRSGVAACLIDQLKDSAHIRKAIAVEAG
ncbi:MAG: NAD(P)-dependent oxidoreductase, partial [Acidobacteriota bacterium]